MAQWLVWRTAGSPSDETALSEYDVFARKPGYGFLSSVACVFARDFKRVQLAPLVAEHSTTTQNRNSRRHVYATEW